jgi:ketosteroid isomerase-like protein
MTIDENKALVRRYLEDAPATPTVCDEILAPTLRFHTIQHAALTPQVIESTPESEKAAYAWLRAVWGDRCVTIDEMIAEGDRVMVRWTFRGTHIGEYHGLAPTGRPVTYSGIDIFRIADGRIAEVWDIYDRLWLWQQLGVLPALRDAIAAAPSIPIPSMGYGPSSAP